MSEGERQRMKGLRFLLPLALIAGALSVPVALGAGAAESIKVSGRVQLVAPATAYVTVTYTCSPAADGATPGQAGVTLVESGVPMAGSTPFTATCDDRSHTETVAVPGAWAPGTGQATAF